MLRRAWRPGRAIAPRVAAFSSTSNNPFGKNAQSAEPMHPGLKFGLGVTGACGAAVAAYYAYRAAVRPEIHPMLTTNVIPEVSDKIFEQTDNMLVFFFDDKEDLERRKLLLQRTHDRLKKISGLGRVSTWHSFQDGLNAKLSERAGTTEDNSKPIHAMAYKGLRKTSFSFYDADLHPDVQEAMIKFYEPVFEEPFEEWEDHHAQYAQIISGAQFVEEVYKKAGEPNIMLLQMYEDTCFMCFLMRPFINSMSRLFFEEGVPVTIRRMNIDKNDFPPKCPVSRGTPTFVAYYNEYKVRKFEEFKPKDVLERISKDVFIPPRTMKVLHGLVEEVNIRFQLFTQYVMWVVELNKLQAMLVDPVKGHDESDADFNMVVQELMVADMQRRDEVASNIRYLRQEVDEAETDLLYCAAQLAEQVLAQEKKLAGKA